VGPGFGTAFDAKERTSSSHSESHFEDFPMKKKKIKRPKPAKPATPAKMAFPSGS